MRRKIALFCDVGEDDVLTCVDCPSIYRVPMSLYEQGFDISVLTNLGLAPRKINLKPLMNFLKTSESASGRVNIAVMGKYVSLPDAYLSVVEMVELPDHCWFVASQAHPGLKSRPTAPHPLFRDFVKAARDCCGLGLNTFPS